MHILMLMLGKVDCQGSPFRKFGWFLLIVAALMFVRVFLPPPRATNQPASSHSVSSTSIAMGSTPVGP